jgi:Zn-dependent protease/CBS domain-containing protein
VNEGFQIGRIAGIRISIHWSWLVVFVLITWTLADSIFPESNPGLSDTAYVAMAVAAALLFFACLLLHELGHALQAKREGVEIEGITLWLFGGVAQFKGLFPSAGAEFRIAIAGPLVSLVLGLFFVLVAWALGLPREVDGVAAWLGFINLFLLAFNMIPALPLDGGRVLRSLLWLRRGDLTDATRTASSIGRGFAYVLILLGLAELVLLGSFGGVWLAFIGWFLLQAASAEARYLAARQALGGLRVADLMVTDPATVRQDMPLGDFVDDVVWSRRFTTYPVVENGKAVGLLPFRCVAETPRREWDERSVRDCMVPLEETPVFRPDEPLIGALERLSASEVSRGLVLEDGRLVGLLSITDLLRALELGGPPGRRRAQTAP